MRTMAKIAWLVGLSFSLSAGAKSWGFETSEECYEIVKRQKFRWADEYHQALQCQDRHLCKKTTSDPSFRSWRENIVKLEKDCRERRSYEDGQMPRVP